MGPSTRQRQPIVIAHRGASGYLPEHTFEAKRLAHESGADYLEQDVVASSDDELVVLHDIHLDRVSNVTSVFAGRHRGDGRYYARDFTMDELRRLEVHERTHADGSLVYPGRHQGDATVYRLHTLAEELAFIARLNDELGRTVGIYPEIKRPIWHRNEGVDIAPLLVETLHQHGYESRRDPVFLQCFEHAELVRIRDDLNSDLKLVQLLGENEWREAESDYDELKKPQGLRELSRTVDAIGPWFNQLYRYDSTTPDRGVQATALTRQAQEAGLAVHPYTFRSDDLAPGFRSFSDLVRFSVDELCVDGFFTDFPDLARQELDRICRR